MNLTSIRREFPLLTKRAKPFVYFDSVATSQKPRSVIEAESTWYENSNANIHRGVYALAEEATAIHEQVREQVAEFLNAPSARCIAFTKGTTEGMNLIAHAWARPNLKRGDVILITEMEHHANIVPWQLLAKEKGLTLRYWPITPQGTLNLALLPKLLRGVKLVSLTHISNVLGTVNPIEKIIPICHRHGIPVAIDAAQSVAHRPLNLKKLKPDFLVFSGHKMYGPTGIGVVYIAPERWNELKPYQSGGEMIKHVEWQSSTFNAMPLLLEAGTQPLAQVAGLGAAIAFLQRIGWKTIEAHEKRLTAYAYKQLSLLPEVTIYGPKPAQRSGLVAFTVKGAHAHDLATWLDQAGICVRAGHHCAQPLHAKLKAEATARVGFGIYSTTTEVDYFIKQLKRIIIEWRRSTTA